MLRTKMFRYHLNAKKMKSKESVHFRIQKALDSMAFGNGMKTTILFSIYTIQILAPLKPENQRKFKVKNLISYKVTKHILSDLK